MTHHFVIGRHYSDISGFVKDLVKLRKTSLAKLEVLSNKVAISFTDSRESYTSYSFTDSKESYTSYSCNNLLISS